MSECDRGTSVMRRIRPTGAVEPLQNMYIYNYVVPILRPNPMPCQELQNMFLRPGGFILSPKSQDKGPPFFGCLRLFIEYIRRCLPKMDLVFSLRNLRTCHAFVTWTHSTRARVNKVLNQLFQKIQGTLAS